MMISISTTTARTIAKRSNPLLRKARMPTNAASLRTKSSKIPEGVAAPQNQYRNDDSSAAARVANVWYQNKRIPLYVTVAATLAFAGYTAQTRTNGNSVQTSLKQRTTPILKPGEGETTMTTPENVQIVSAVANLVGDDPKRNPQGLGVDPKQWQQEKEVYKQQKQQPL